LSNLPGLFANNILPIFLAAGTGYLISKFLGVSPKPISQILFYIFSPCLLFDLLTKNQLSSSDVVRVMGFAAVSTFAIGALAWVVAKAFRFHRRMLTAIVLVAMFGNAGNYGLSLNKFAFGEQALAYASLYFTTSAILIYTVGVFIASSGNSSAKAALLGLYKIPAVHAVVLTVLFSLLGWKLPLPLERTVSTLGSAAIPGLLVLMGIQLQHARWDGQTLALGLATSLRLVIAPLISFAFVALFGLKDASYQAAMSESAMPTAVVMTVLATEYDIEPSFVTTVVFMSTLLSPLTLTPLLAFLGA